MEDIGLPQELQAQINIIAIQTGKPVAEVYSMALLAGLNILEETVTNQYAFIKVDQDGNFFNLNGDLLKR